MGSSLAPEGSLGDISSLLVVPSLCSYLMVEASLTSALSPGLKSCTAGLELGLILDSPHGFS